MSIRVRLALWGVAVAGLTLLLFGLGFERLLASAIPEDQDRALATRAERAVASLAHAPPASLASGLPPAADDLATSTDLFVAVVDQDGQVRYTSARLDGALDTIPPSLRADVARAGSGKATVRTRSGVELRIHARRWARNDLELAGLVVVGQATRFAERQIAESRVFLIVTGIVTLLIAALATWVVSGRALRPLKQLATTADEIGRTGDLGRRLPAKRPKDVTGVLAASFNGMLDRLGASQRRLEEALEAQRRFVADASHELRNPLTTIRSNAGFLLEHPDAGMVDRADALADIAAEGERMGHIVGDLLTLARADAGHPLDRLPVELGAVARDVAHAARHAGRPIRLDLDGPLTALGDPDALHRLVAILVDNAVRHGAGEIELRLGRSGDDAVLSVSDSGPGIPEPELERIFERFYQLDPARQEAGAGLGLGIARALADAHAGSIRAANRPDGGAVFELRLPLAKAQP